MYLYALLCQSYIPICHPSLAFTCMLSVCHSCVVVCHSYVTRHTNDICHLYVARMYSYVIRMSLECTCMSSVCHSYVLVCHLYVTRMYLYVIRMSLVCTRMSSVRHSYVLVCHPYVIRMYLYVIFMSLECTRMSSVCHLYVLVGHLYLTHMYSYVIHISLIYGFTMNPVQVDTVYWKFLYNSCFFLFLRHGIHKTKLYIVCTTGLNNCAPDADRERSSPQNLWDAPVFLCAHSFPCKKIIIIKKNIRSTSLSTRSTLDQQWKSNSEFQILWWTPAYL